MRWGRACLEGLQHRRDEINALNVFPIPDGDTGTNLLATMRAAVAAAETAVLTAHGGVVPGKVDPEAAEEFTETHYSDDTVHWASSAGRPGTSSELGLLPADENPIRRIADAGWNHDMSASPRVRDARPPGALPDGMPESRRPGPGSAANRGAQPAPGDGGVATEVRAAGQETMVPGYGVREPASTRAANRFPAAEASAHLAAAAMARGATAGARGNSGIILSQVLRGLAEATETGPLTGHTYRTALARGAALVRAGLSAPVEGTMLTVLDRAAACAAACTETILADIALAAADGAAGALEDTPDQLGVLRAAGVVDAGALGLLVLLDCMVVIAGGEPPVRPEYLRDRVGVARAPEPPLAPGYEVMYRVADTNEARVADLRHRLADIGDSVVVVGDGDRTWSVHVHCVDAGAAVEVGLAAGTVSGIRIESFASDRPSDAHTHAYLRSHDHTNAHGRHRIDPADRTAEQTPHLGRSPEQVEGTCRVRVHGSDQLDQPMSPPPDEGPDPAGHIPTKKPSQDFGPAPAEHTHGHGQTLEYGAIQGSPAEQAAVSDCLEPRSSCETHTEPAAEVPVADRGVLAVVAGVGAAALFEAAGAVVLGGDEPVTPGALLSAIRRMPHREVLVLPNGALPAHELVAVGMAARDADRDVLLLPSGAMVQGLAALAVHDRNRVAVDDVFAMSESAAATRWGSLRAATGRALTMVGTCEPGDGLGLVGHDVVVIDRDVRAAGQTLLDRMLGLGGELVTLLVGAAAPDGLAGELAGHIGVEFPGVEVTVYTGGQHDDLLQIGVE
ncbi:DAK2 domain-containing protein [Nocardia donostiensis]|uniref:DAK2 domain-containing protein n=1 Tax=Nocardia donostiensis TaxID=1538463 RepID=UPI001FE5C8AA|nr:DAK2 domain-containing protein [Nocardia donostiensis]